eukprot:gene7225-31713_t
MSAPLLLVFAVASVPVPLIIDTDAGFDVDDVGAVCIGNALMDAGEANIIAVGHTNGYDKGIGAISTLMHFYGRDTVPLGSYKGPWARNPNAPGAKGSADRYISDLVEHYPSPVKNYSQVPDAVSVYRKALAGQADNSVAIASIGITTNMRDLVLSSPDQYSKLNGHDLVAQKVNRVVWMDGMYNFGCAQHDSDNWLGPDTDCRGSAQAAVQGWPANVKQVFSPPNVGIDVHHGSWLTNCAAYGNPCRQAFEDWLGPNNGRDSWDPITVVAAVRGSAGVHCKESRQVYSGSPQDAISFELNQLLCKPPGPWSTTNWTKAGGENCYGPRGASPAHGATDLEHPADSSCGTMSLDECKHKCLELPGCTAIAVDPKADGQVDCYRKADVVLGSCDHATTLSTYIRHDWVLAKGFNCYGGHGATDMETPPSADCGTMEVKACQAKCSATPGCTSITWIGSDHSGIGKCYRKKDVVLAKCDTLSGYDTYINTDT